MTAPYGSLLKARDLLRCVPVVSHVRAIRSLRWNYRWRGVWIWLRSPRVRLPGRGIEGRGWWLWLRHPVLVGDWGHAMAEGVIF